MNPLDAAEHYAVALIAKKARGLAHSRGFHPHEEQDIRQELWAELSRKAPRYRPDIAKPTTFVGMIVKRKVIDLARDRTALKRNGGTMKSLDTVEAASGQVPVDERLRRNHCGVNVRGANEVAQIKIDLDEFIGSLPPEAQDLCRRHLETGRFGCVAGTRAQGALQLLRERAVAAGLGGYLVEGADSDDVEVAPQPQGAVARGRESA